MTEPIFITGIERSGSSLIARIMELCGVFMGKVNNMYENIALQSLCNEYIRNSMENGELFPITNNLSIPVWWENEVKEILSTFEGYKSGVWMFKDAQLARMWPIWHYAFPNARWVVVRRKTPDIIHSCVNTAYMNKFKDEKNLEKVNAITEEDGWKWWIHQCEDKFVEMIERGLDVKQVWPERMVDNDYRQISQMLRWLDLKWTDKIISTIGPLLTKSRRNEIWLA